MQTIFLIGFMASGKTYFGKKLARQLGLQFVDLDELVAEATGKQSVSDLINEKGMDYFRKAEEETLKALRPERIVVATGGGTPCFSDNLEWMKARGVVIFLNVHELAIV